MVEEKSLGEQMILMNILTCCMAEFEIISKVEGYEDLKLKLIDKIAELKLELGIPNQ